MKRERTDETGQPSPLPLSEDAFVARNAVLGSNTLCNHLIVPWLHNVLDVFNLSFTCTHMRTILRQNKHLIVATAAYAAELEHEQAVRRDMVVVFGNSRLIPATPPRMPGITLCAREGSLLAFRYFFHKRVWAYLEDAQECSASGIAEPEVVLSFATEEEHRRSALRHFSEIVVFALTEAGSAAARNGHADIVTEVATRCKQTPKAEDRMDALSMHNFSAIVYSTLRGAANSGHFDICRRFSNSDVWGLSVGGGWTDVRGFLTVAEELLKSWTMKELEEWGVLALPPGKVRGARLRAFAMSNTRDFAVFDWAHASAKRAGSKKTLSQCIGYVASRGNLPLLQHVAKRMLVEEVAHLAAEGPKKQWEEALKSVGKIEDAVGNGSRSPGKQERREKCIAWVYNQAGYDDGMRNGWLASMVNGEIDRQEAAAQGAIGWEYRE